MEVFPYIGAFAAVAGIIVWMVSSLHRIGQRDKSHHSLPNADELTDRMADLEQANEERFAELEERLEFTERMLTAERERRQLKPGDLKD